MVVLGGELDVVDQVIEVHGADQVLVLDARAVRERNSVANSVNRLDVLVEKELVLGEGAGNSLPDTSGTVTGRELEGGVRTPVTSDLLVQSVGNNELERGSGDTLTEPLALHHGGRNSPDLEVVRTHEEISETLTHHTHDPLVERSRGILGASTLLGSVDHALDALDLFLDGEDGDVVLVRVRDPDVLGANVRDTLVLVPVLLVGEGLCDHVVKVLVVREDDVSSDIEEEAFVGGIGRGETTGLLVGINKEPWAVVLIAGRKKHKDAELARR